MKIKIEKITRKEIKTPNGREPTAWNIGILSNDVWYSAWAGEWNQEWKEGQTIDVEIKTNGKFNNIIPPKGQSAPRPQNNRGATDSQVLDEINNKLGQLMAEILEVKNILKPQQPELPKPPKEDIPF